MLAPLTRDARSVFDRSTRSVYILKNTDICNPLRLPKTEYP